MLYFPYIYTEQHVEFFFVKAQNDEKLTKQVQEIAKLQTHDEQVNAILDSERLSQALEGCRKTKDFKITKAVIEKHKRTVKMNIYAFADKIEHSYELTFTPILEAHTDNITAIRRRIMDMKAESTLFTKEQELEIKKKEQSLERAIEELHDYQKANPPFTYTVRTMAHKKKDEYVEFEFRVDKMFIAQLNEQMSNFSENFHVELNKPQR